MIDLPPPPNFEQTIEAIVRCDIPRANVRIAYEDYLQSDEITISDVGELTDDKLRCLKSAVHPFYILTLKDDAQQLAFYEFSEREDRPKRKADARDWLQANGLLEQIPAFDPAVGLNRFATELERVCGLKEGSALLVQGTSALLVRADFLRSNALKSAEHFQCLTRLFAASDADEHDISLGFIGNEAIGESDA